MTVSWIKEKFVNKKISEADDSMALFDAIAAFEDGNYAEAESMFSNMIRSDKKHPLAYIMVARTLILQKKNAQALDYLFHHLNYVDSKSIEALTYMGLVYYELEDTKSALKFFELAYTYREENLLIKENLAIANLELGKLDEALEFLSDLYDEFPQDRVIGELLVNTLGRLGKWEPAGNIIHALKNDEEYYDDSTLLPEYPVKTKHRFIH